MQTTPAAQPAVLIEAVAKMNEAKAKYAAAKSKRAINDAYDDIEFWSNKAAMLDVMAKRGMLQGGAA